MERGYGYEAVKAMSLLEIKIILKHLTRAEQRLLKRRSYE